MRTINKILPQSFAFMALIVITLVAISCKQAEAKKAYNKEVESESLVSTHSILFDTSVKSCCKGIPSRVKACVKGK